MSKGRIGIIYSASNLDTVPSLCSAAELLAAAGFGVDIFAGSGEGHARPEFDDAAIEVLPFRPRYARDGIYRFLPGRLAYPFEIWQRHLRRPYRCFIGVDADALIYAHSLASMVRVPLVYYSLELLLSYEIQADYARRLKEKEAPLSRQAAFVIIQDRDRARLLAEDNRIPADRFVLVPNSPLGPARRKHSRYWHDKFNLPANRKVVLHAGSVGPWTGITDIVDSVAAWTADWTLIIHTRFDPTRFGKENPERVRRLQERADPERVLFSLKPVSRAEYDELVDAADIGIAFYVPASDGHLHQRNDQIIGFSSGKLAYYLRAGKPVIVNDGATLGEFVKREGCGIAVHGAAEIGSAISRIAESEEQFGARACRTFDNHLDFRCGFQEVIRRIESLEAN